MGDLYGSPYRKPIQLSRVYTSLCESMGLADCSPAHWHGSTDCDWLDLPDRKRLVSTDSSSRGVEDDLVVAYGEVYPVTLMEMSDKPSVSLKTRRALKQNTTGSHPSSPPAESRRALYLVKNHDDSLVHFVETTGFDVYFRNSSGPWRYESNENPNGLISQIISSMRVSPSSAPTESLRGRRSYSTTGRTRPQDDRHQPAGCAYVSRNSTQ